MANVLLGLSAALHLHGIFYCIRSPDTFQTMVTEPSHPLAMQVKDRSHFPTGKRREDRVKWFSPELYSRAEAEAETEPVLNSGARQYSFCLEYGRILKGRIGKYIKGKSSPC